MIRVHMTGRVSSIKFYPNKDGSQSVTLMLNTSRNVPVRDATNNIVAWKKAYDKLKMSAYIPADRVDNNVYRQIAAKCYSEENRDKKDDFFLGPEVEIEATLGSFLHKGEEVISKGQVVKRDRRENTLTIRSINQIGHPADNPAHKAPELSQRKQDALKGLSAEDLFALARQKAKAAKEAEKAVPAEVRAHMAEIAAANTVAAPEPDTNPDQFVASDDVAAFGDAD